MNFHLLWEIDFTTQRIKANVRLQMLALKNLTFVNLDWWNLELADVPTPCVYTLGTTSTPVNCSVIQFHENQGDQLHIDAQIPYNTVFNLTI